MPKSPRSMPSNLARNGHTWSRVFLHRHLGSRLLQSLTSYGAPCLNNTSIINITSPTAWTCIWRGPIINSNITLCGTVTSSATWPQCYHQRSSEQKFRSDIRLRCMPPYLGESKLYHRMFTLLLYHSLVWLFRFLSALMNVTFSTIRTCLTLPCV